MHILSVVAVALSGCVRFAAWYTRASIRKPPLSKLLVSLQITFGVTWPALPPQTGTDSMYLRGVHISTIGSYLSFQITVC